MKKIILRLSSIVLLAIILGACASDAVTPQAPTIPVTPSPSVPQTPTNPGTTSINVDNDYWFGTIGGGVYGGLGFKQSGANVSAVFAYATDADDVSVCCMLSGTLQGQQLSMSYVDSVGDTIMITGTFTSSVTLTGSLVFILDGVRQDPFALSFGYEGELDDYSRMLVPEKLTSLRHYYEKLLAQ